TNYVCSGSVAGNSAVLTAGHCVSDGRGTYHSNWIFKPAFRFKDGPAGSWTARKFITFDQYHNRGYLGRDVAFAIVNRRDNKNIEQVVGGRLGFKRASFGEPVIGKSKRKNIDILKSNWISTSSLWRIQNGQI